MYVPGVNNMHALSIGNQIAFLLLTSIILMYILILLFIGIKFSFKEVIRILLNNDRMVVPCLAPIFPFPKLLICCLEGYNSYLNREINDLSLF